jgi:DNA-binding NarL/FixJ family response regulator
MKALVVDDHALVREGLKQVLRRIEPGIAITEAGSAGEAIRVLEAQPDQDLVLVDLALPDQSGFGILKKLRQEQSSAVVVVLSASTGREDIQRAFDHGASGYIPKAASAGVTLGALRLVLAGGMYIPPEIVEAEGRTAEWRTVDRVDAPMLRPSELGLSDRQTQVLALLVRGMTNKAIARQLKLAEQTVKAHISAALRTLNVSNRTQAVIAVSQLGIDLQDEVAGRAVRGRTAL